MKLNEKNSFTSGYSFFVKADRFTEVLPFQIGKLSLNVGFEIGSTK